MLATTCSMACASNWMEQPAGTWGNPDSTSFLMLKRRPERSAANFRSTRYFLCIWATKSSTTRHSFPLACRRPRPSCCRNTVKLSVGRRNRTRLASGMSTPSLNRSTVKMNFRSPDRSRCTAALRTSSFVWLVSAMEGIPFSLKLWAMNSACLMLTQNPRPLTPPMLPKL